MATPAVSYYGVANARTERWGDGCGQGLGRRPVRRRGELEQSSTSSTRWKGHDLPHTSARRPGRVFRLRCGGQDDGCEFPARCAARTFCCDATDGQYPTLQRDLTGHCRTRPLKGASGEHDHSAGGIVMRDEGPVIWGCRLGNVQEQPERCTEDRSIPSSAGGLPSTTARSAPTLHHDPELAGQESDPRRPSSSPRC